MLGKNSHLLALFAGLEMTFCKYLLTCQITGNCSYQIRLPETVLTKITVNGKAGTHPLHMRQLSPVYGTQI
jgi:hypothetical protein